MRTDLMLNGRRAAGRSGSNAAPSLEPFPDINSILDQSEARWSIPGRGALSRWRPDAGSSLLAGRAALPVFDDHDTSSADTPQLLHAPDPAGESGSSARCS